MRLRIPIVVSAFCLAIFFGGFSVSAHAQKINKRLILTDGSYQPASQWEIQGDRVHYFSSERHEWEDIPKSLIDWKATDDYNSGKSNLHPSDANLTDEMRKEAADEAAERAQEAAQTPTVAPGLNLPSEGGVFILDRFEGKPSLAEVVQNGSELNKQMGRNILRAAINPISTSAKQSIELKGEHARVQAHSARPTIYIDIDQDTQAQPLRVEDRFRLVRVQSRKGNRVVGNLKVSLIGKTSEQTFAVKTEAEKFSGDWVKIVPLEDLPDGEYAIVEMLSDKSMNTYVWDFGVNPSAPSNPAAWKPDPLKANSTGSEDSPVLIPKKK